VLPNSAPDSLTPKNLNLVRLPEHTLELGAVDVEVVLVLPPAGVVVVLVGVEVAAPGKHCE
jgi:hypothetical protein